ncbi:MAG: PDZ domain-containing protein, partial [Planctomycetes bacterium]|nr:PDZ domain-containing protein [Planctomycetota bacterium]
MLSPDEGAMILVGGSGAPKIYAIDGSNPLELPLAATSTLLWPRSDTLLSFDAGVLKLLRLRNEKWEVAAERTMMGVRGVESACITADKSIALVATDSSYQRSLQCLRAEDLSSIGVGAQVPAADGNGFAVSPNGAYLASTAADSVMIFDAVEGKLLKVHQASNVSSTLVFSPDSSRVWLKSSSADYQSHTLIGVPCMGGEVRTFALPQHASYEFALSPDGRAAVFSLFDYTEGESVSLALIDLESGSTQVSAPLRPASSVYDISFDPDGRGIRTLASDGSVFWWPTRSLEALPPVGQGLEGQTRFLPHNSCVAKLGYDGTLEVLPVVRPLGKALTPWRIATALTDPMSMTFSRDGRLAAIWNYSGEVAVVDLLAKRVATRIKLGNEEVAINALALNADGTRLYVQLSSGFLRSLALDGLSTEFPAEFSSSRGGSADELYFRVLQSEEEAAGLAPSTDALCLGPEHGELMVPNLAGYDDDSMGNVYRGAARLSPMIDRAPERFVGKANETSYDVKRSPDRQHFAFKVMSNEGESALEVIHFENGKSRQERIAGDFVAFRPLNDGRVLARRSDATFVLIDQGKIETITEAIQNVYPDYLLRVDRAGRVAMANDGGTIRIVHLDKSRPMRSIELGWGINSPCLSGDGKELIYMSDDELVALSTETGDELWRKEHESISWGSIHQYDDEHVLVLGNDSRLLMLRCADGALQGTWKLQALNDRTIVDVDAKSGEILTSGVAPLLSRFNIKDVLTLQGTLTKLDQKEVLAWAENASQSTFKGFSLASRYSRRPSPWPLPDPGATFGKAPKWWQQTKPAEAKHSDQLARDMAEQRAHWVYQTRLKVTEANAHFGDGAFHEAWKVQEPHRWAGTSKAQLEHLPSRPEFTTSAYRLAIAQWLHDLGATSFANVYNYAEALLIAASNESRISVRRELTERLREIVKDADHFAPSERADLAVARGRAAFLIDDVEAAQGAYREAFELYAYQGDAFESALHELLIAYAARFDRERSIEELKRNRGRVDRAVYSKIRDQWQSLGACRETLEAGKYALPRQIVTSTVASSAAREAGIKPADVIVSVNDQQVQSIGDLNDTLLAAKSDRGLAFVAITVLRGQEFRTFVLRFRAGDAAHGMLLHRYGEQPDEEAASLFGQAMNEVKRFELGEVAESEQMTSLKRIEALMRKSLARHESLRANYWLAVVLTLLNKGPEALPFIEKALARVGHEAGVSANEV